MHVTLIGISHRTAPVEVREAFAFGAAELPEALAILRPFGEGVLLLSTCNRTEIYVSSPHRIQEPHQVLAMLARLHGGMPACPDAPFYLLAGADAVRHLYRVAAGLDSQILGEAEILGQVRTAFTAANASGACDAVLSRMFHGAIRAGRRARSETHIGRYAVSMSSAAVALARSTVGELEEKTALVVSAGEAGKLTARALHDAGVQRMFVTNRNLERAVELAETLGGQAVPFDHLPWALAQSDVVISATGSTHPVITSRLVDRAIQGRNGRHLLIIDIAIPRDVEPEVAALHNVHLHNLDDLQELSNDNLEARRAEVHKVEVVVEDEAHRFLEWLGSLHVLPTISALRAQAEQIRTSELERTLGRLDLSDEDRHRVEAMTSAIVKKLLHTPIDTLKQTTEGQRYVEAARTLFGLDDQERPD